MHEGLIQCLRPHGQVKLHLGVRITRVAVLATLADVLRSLRHEQSCLPAHTSGTPAWLASLWQQAEVMCSQRSTPKAAVVGPPNNSSLFQDEVETHGAVNDPGGTRLDALRVRPSPTQAIAVKIGCTDRWLANIIWAE